jgi:DNA-binding response OmpR family regulator
MKSNNTKLALPRILIYQDEDCKILVDYLVYNGFQIITSTENDILIKIREKNYDLCILSHYKTTDASMRLKPLKFLRKSDNKIPVIMVSDKVRYEYVIEAFDEGADDYVIRPYNIEELIRRIKAVLKRCGVRVRNIEPSYEIGDYLFNTVDKILTIGDVKTRLNNKQSQILALLCAYKNETLLKKILMQQVWANDNYFNKRSLDVYMCMLRNMLKMDNRVVIETIRGVGYSLVIKEDESLM